MARTIALISVLVIGASTIETQAAHLLDHPHLPVVPGW